MANTTDTTSGIRLATLGELTGAAQGKLQPSNFDVMEDQVTQGWRILGNAASYSKVDPTKVKGVSCMDDRLDSPLRLAGGALSEALMYHYLYGGDRLSDILYALKQLKFYLKLHDDCGALVLLQTILRQLADTDADGYKLLAHLNVSVLREQRQLIADWADTVPSDFVDLEKCKEIIDEFEPVQGPHVAGYAALIARRGSMFAGETTLEQRSGLKALVVTMWAADYSAAHMTDSVEDAARAAVVAKVFSAQVLLALAGPELVVAMLRDV